MTKHEQDIVERMKFMGESGKRLLDKHPHIRKKTQRQAIRQLSRMVVSEKQEGEFLKNFTTQFPSE